ncbi:nucleolar protein 12-domain-containing protein [Cyathus striatus]|nr:nucleolar protein 12-domain-containing protein [Cyathus striatus]
MSRNNIALLTQSHKALAAKRKAKREQIKEILFDEDARRDFLTGFHKRKVARTEAAREKAKEREKLEHQEARREQRRALRERAKENAAIVEKAYGALSDDDDDEWPGIDIDKETQERDEEYENEEIVATVTVVEDFDPESLTHGPIPRQNSSKKAQGEENTLPNKDARKADRQKQRARRTEKAELAGGKASRKKSISVKRKGNSKH